MVSGQTKLLHLHSFTGGDETIEQIRIRVLDDPENAGYFTDYTQSASASDYRGKKLLRGTTKISKNKPYTFLLLFLTS